MKILNLDLKYNGVVNMSDDIVRYKDFNFARLKTDQKLNRNYVFILARVAIGYLSKLILIFALLTYKAEYISIYKARKEAVWLRYKLAKLGFQKKSISIILYANN